MNKECEINVFNPEQYVAGVPHEKFRALRESFPVSFQREKNGPGYWAITRYEDIIAVSKNPGLFSSSKGGINIPDATEEDLEVARLILINMDPPQHAKYRRLVATGFTPKMTARLESAIRVAATTLLDRISGHKKVDFVATIASALPLYLIADLIGWPEQDRDKMFDWSDRVARIDYHPDDARLAAFEFWGYCSELIESLDPAESAADDLLHTLLRAEIDGEGLTQLELVNFLLLLAIGGNETTRNCISGGFLALHDHPAELDKVRGDPQQYLPLAVEEMLRFTSPIIAFRRTATADTTLHQTPIREGDKIVLYYASGNRDERIFDRPDDFDVGRTPNPHLSFGAGHHFCLGATLARMEIKVLFEEILRRFPEMKPASAVTRLESNYVNGILNFDVDPGPDQEPPS